MTGQEWVPFVLVGSEGLWAADCLVPGCLWTCTTSTCEAADRLALSHTTTDHANNHVHDHAHEGSSR